MTRVVLGDDFLNTWTPDSGGNQPALLCRLATSWAWHLEMVSLRVRSHSFSTSSTISPSMKPSIIWSQILFCVHISKQKLHVLASSCRDTSGLSFLLCSSMDVPAFDCFVDLALNIAFDGGYYVLGLATLGQLSTRGC